jgi:chaperonin GroES
MFTPVSNYVAIKRSHIESKSDGGIFIPMADSQNEKNIGTVAAIGDKVNAVSEGDRVVFDPLAGKDFKANGITYLMVKDTDVLAIV